MIREHEFYRADDKGRQWCMHCGALYQSYMTATCIERPGVAETLAPEPARRVPACEDQDTIRARLEELAREHEAVLNSPSAQETT